MRAEQGDLTSCHILSPNPGIARGEGDTDAGAGQGFLGGQVGAHPTMEPVGEEPVGEEPVGVEPGEVGLVGVEPGEGGACGEEPGGVGWEG